MKSKKVDMYKENRNMLNKGVSEIKAVRQGWAEQFKKMNENGDDELLIDDYYVEDIELLDWI